MQDVVQTKINTWLSPVLIKHTHKKDPTDAHCCTLRPWNAGRVHPEIIPANFVSHTMRLLLSDFEVFWASFG